MRPDGTNSYELEVQALRRLVSELESKMEEMESKIEDEKEVARAIRRAEKRAEQGLPPADAALGEEEPLSPSAGGTSVEMKEF